jgi:hypothetical protein
MVHGVRASLAKVALVVVAALGAAGCDTGGLLVVEHKPGEQPPVQGPNVNDMVAGGNYASNGRYRIFYTLGQPSPAANVASNPGGTKNNGGLIGASQGN